MKETNSETAMRPTGANTPVGQPHGVAGANQITAMQGKPTFRGVIATANPSPQQIEQMQPTLTRLLGQLQNAKGGSMDRTVRDNANLAIDFCNHVSRPAPPAWIAGRVATLHAQTFIPNQDPAVRKQVAADWLDALERFPAWAIKAAVDDWNASGHNGRPPTSGDIAELCGRQMRPIRKLNNAARELMR